MARYVVPFSNNLLSPAWGCMVDYLSTNPREQRANSARRRRLIHYVAAQLDRELGGFGHETVEKATVHVRRRSRAELVS